MRGASGRSVNLGPADADAPARIDGARTSSAGDARVDGVGVRPGLPDGTGTGPRGGGAAAGPWLGDSRAFDVAHLPGAAAGKLSPEATARRAV